MSEHSSAQSRIDGGHPSLCIEEKNGSFLPSKSMSEVRGRKVHGICSLPHGYALAILPPQSPIIEICKDKRDKFEIPYISSLSTGSGGELTTPRPHNNNSPSPDMPPAIELSSTYSLPQMCYSCISNTVCIGNSVPSNG